MSGAQTWIHGVKPHDQVGNPKSGDWLAVFSTTDSLFLKLWTISLIDGGSGVNNYDFELVTAASDAALLGNTFVSLNPAVTFSSASTTNSPLILSASIGQSITDPYLVVRCTSAPATHGGGCSINIIAHRPV